MGSCSSGAIVNRSTERKLFLIVSTFLVILVLGLSFFENKYFKFSENINLFNKIFLISILSVSFYFLLGSSLKNMIFKVYLCAIFLLVNYFLLPNVKKNSEILMSKNDRITFTPAGIEFDSSGKEKEASFYIIGTMAYVSKISIDKSREATLQKELSFLRVGKITENFVAFGRGNHFNGEFLEGRRDVSDEIIKKGSSLIHDTVFFSESGLLWKDFLKYSRQAELIEVKFLAIVDGEEVFSFCKFSVESLMKLSGINSISASFTLRCMG